jgi:glycosyltransferase involved in cell wall biosynthesis
MVVKAIPYPPGEGSAMRSWEVIRALAANGHSVDLLSFGQPADIESAGGALRQVCRSVEVLPHVLPNLSSTARYWHRLGRLLSPTPYSVAILRSPVMTKRIAQLLRENAFDIVMCESLYLFDNLPLYLPVPVILDCHNVESLLLRRFLGSEPNPAKRAYVRLEWAKLHRWERGVVLRASLVMVCSEHDRAVMTAMCPGARLTVVPNIIDVTGYVPSDGDDGDGFTILYSGAMDWYPNQDAVRYFVEDIWPEVRRLVPGARFRVAGRHPSMELRRRLEGVAGVELAGAVPDMRAEVRRAAVCVVPLRIGSGTRLKILEAAALAKAIVSTRVGAEGLDFVDGREILLADEPRAFARAVADLATDLRHRRSLGAAARLRVEGQYGFPHLRRAMQDAVARLG